MTLEEFADELRYQPEEVRKRQLCTVDEQGTGKNRPVLSYSLLAVDDGVRSPGVVISFVTRSAGG